MELLYRPSFDGGGLTPWFICQGAVEADTHGGADTSLLTQELYGRLALADSLQMSEMVHLDAILSVDEALRELCMFDFFAFHFFFTGGRHLSAATNLL